MYGIWKSAQHAQRMTTVYPQFSLLPVLEWRTQIIQVKQVPAGTYVGYQKTFKTVRPTMLALVPLGYSDGYSYALSNKGQGLIHNQYAPVVGIVSMNLTAFDVTDIPGIKRGDEIILLGNAPSIMAHDYAQRANLITNNVMTMLPSFIARSIVPAHQPLSLPESQKRLQK